MLVSFQFDLLCSVSNAKGPTQIQRIRLTVEPLWLVMSATDILHESYGRKIQLSSVNYWEQYCNVVIFRVSPKSNNERVSNILLDNLPLQVEELNLS